MKIIYFQIPCLLMLFLVLHSCKKVDLDHIDNLNNGKIDVIGHGGSGFQTAINPYPTNSFISITHALDGLNADGVELDAQISKDSVLFLYHDKPLEQNTNCTGCILNANSEELLNCMYKNKFGSRGFKDDNLCTFQKLIDEYKNREKKPIIYFSTKIYEDCLPANAKKEHSRWVINKIISMIKENNAYDWVYIYDEDVELLETIKSLDPKIVLFFNAKEFEHDLDVCLSYNYSGIVIANSKVSKDQVKRAHSHGKKLIIWETLTRKNTVEAIEKHLDGIMTDNLPLLIQILTR